MDLDHRLSLVLDDLGAASLQRRIAPRLERLARLHVADHRIERLAVGLHLGLKPGDARQVCRIGGDPQTRVGLDRQHRPAALAEFVDDRGLVLVGDDRREVDDQTRTRPGLLRRQLDRDALAEHHIGLHRRGHQPLGPQERIRHRGSLVSRGDVLRHRRVRQHPGRQVRSVRIESTEEVVGELREQLVIFRRRRPDAQQAARIQVVVLDGVVRRRKRCVRAARGRGNAPDLARRRAPDFPQWLDVHDGPGFRAERPGSTRATFRPVILAETPAEHQHAGRENR